MMAVVLADALLEKCGGDSMDEVLRNLRGYLATVAAYPAIADGRAARPDGRDDR
jgi:ribosomal protein L12E/L44/L45/RPP1/RPP2